LRGNSFQHIHKQNITLENTKILDLWIHSLHKQARKESEFLNKLVEGNQNKLIVQDTDDKSSGLNSAKMRNLHWKMGSPYGSVAFIWEKNDENCFLTHSHFAGKYHHSSLNGGKSVRCAGMWLVKDGIVEMINNSSGHYRPTSLNYYQMIRFLYSKALINEETTICDMLRQVELADATQPFGGVESQYYPLKEYLPWAENLPEIIKYLEQESLKPLFHENQNQHVDLAKAIS
jgi:hypothetical protein